jgi:transcriptional regulator with XRE-family HTH domain
MSPTVRCRCGTLLARDNAAPTCAGCEHRRPASRSHAPEVPPGFWQTDAMIAALASGDLGRIILAYRSHPFHGRRPLSQAVVADWLHVSQTSLSRIEHGRCRLSIDDIAGFSRALGLSVALRWTPLPQAGEDVDPLSRRSLFGAGVGAAVGLTATTAPTAARELDPEIVPRWMALLDVLIRHDNMCGPHDVLATVSHQIAMIAECREVARGELHSQLLREEARWSRFASWIGHDAGDARLFEDALRGWPRESTRGRGIHQARLARACAYADEPERAAYEGAGALDVARMTRSTVLTQQLERLDRQLAAYDSPAVADFREAYAAL